MQTVYQFTGITAHNSTGLKIIKSLNINVDVLITESLV